MRIKSFQALTLSASEGIREIEAQREIENFLRALSSYPERFAQEPTLSFEQHMISIIAGAQSVDSGSRQS
jgi:hypothetical protein